MVVIRVKAAPPRIAVKVDEKTHVISTVEPRCHTLFAMISSKILERHMPIQIDTAMLLYIWSWNSGPTWFNLYNKEKRFYSRNPPYVPSIRGWIFRNKHHWRLIQHYLQQGSGVWIPTYTSAQSMGKGYLYSFGLIEQDIPHHPSQFDEYWSAL